MWKKINYNSQVGVHAIINEDIPPNCLYYNEPNKGIIPKKL